MKKKINKFSVVIPTYNEKHNIAPLIKKIDKYLKNFFYEIIVIDDNSKDGTKLALKEIKSSKKNFTFHIRKKKRDLSQSLILGIKKTKFNNIIIMDGDLQHNPKYLPEIVRIFFKKKIYISNKKNIYGKGFKLLFDLIYSSTEPFKIKEYKIIFNKRKNNKSKMSLKVIFHILVAIFYYMLMKLLR